MFLFLLNRNIMWNLAWPPILTHWSMKTIMSMPVTMKMDLVKVKDKDKNLFNNCSRSCWNNLYSN